MNENIKQNAVKFNWFTKPRSARWKFWASALWFIVNAAVVPLIIVSRSWGEGEAGDFAEKVGRIFVWTTLLGLGVILSRPRRASKFKEGDEVVHQPTGRQGIVVHSGVGGLVRVSFEDSALGDVIRPEELQRVK